MRGAFAALLARAEDSGANWVQGAIEFVDRKDTFLETLSPKLEGRLFAARMVGQVYIQQPSIIRRDTIMKTSGFDSQFITSQDTDFFLQIAALGEVAVVSKAVARIRLGNTDASHTKYWLRDEMDRMVREKAFDRRDCIRLIRTSLQDVKDPWVRGRIVYYYLGSAIRNMRSGAIMKSFSRLWSALVLGVVGLGHRRYWSGLTKKAP